MECWTVGRNRTLHNERMSSVEVLPPAVRWDLSALFSSMEDPKIESTWALSHERADAFAAKYRGKINSPDLTAETLSQALSELEELTTDVAKPMAYSNLLFAGDASNAAIGAFMQSQMERATELQVKLMFFDLELQAAPSEVIDKLQLKQPPNRTAVNVDEGQLMASEIGYPLMVRPSYVLGGRAMEIIYNKAELNNYLRKAVSVSNDSPVLWTAF